jgi:hypothetical protein
MLTSRHENIGVERLASFRGAARHLARLGSLITG